MSICILGVASQGYMIKLIPEEKKNIEVDDDKMEIKYCPNCGFQLVSAGDGLFYGRYKCYKCVKIFDFSSNVRS